jgi:hypothetical protein
MYELHSSCESGVCDIRFPKNMKKYEKNPNITNHFNVKKV